MTGDEALACYSSELHQKKLERRKNLSKKSEIEKDLKDGNLITYGRKIGSTNEWIGFYPRWPEYDYFKSPRFLLLLRSQRFRSSTASIVFFKVRNLCLAESL